MEYKYRLLSYCKNYWEIENYELAKKDNFKGWVCHHRYEIDDKGECKYTVDELKELNLYYDRPPFELIFLTTKEHAKIHLNTHKYKEIMSKVKLNHEVTDETKLKISKHNIGRFKGMKWKVINGKRVWYSEDNNEVR